MTIVLAHNFYQRPGGEDHAFANEAGVLRSAGHEVALFCESNHRVSAMSRLTLLGATLWNGDTSRRLGDLVRDIKADIVHFHNTFPLLSPSCYSAARRAGAAVVQTLHNYRLLCPGATLYRSRAVCGDCIGRPIAWPGIMHGCYRHSRSATAAVAAMTSIHRLLGTWRSDVDVFVALSESSKSRFVAGGLPGHKIVVKPGFVYPDPGAGLVRSDFVLYVGRLSEEKGLRTLMAAWKQLSLPAHLKLIGDGPLSDWLSAEIATTPSAEWLGHRPHHEVLNFMKQATLLVFPSECWETFGITVIEAFATGLPVLASDSANSAGLVDLNRTGLVFRAGCPEDLRVKLEWILGQPQHLRAMGHACRDEFERLYNAGSARRALEDIYQRALHEAALRH